MEMSVLNDIVRAQREGKALGAHPAFMDPLTPVSTYTAGSPREDAKLTQREAPRHLDAYGGNQAVDWVYDCVNLYAETASGAKWHFEKAGKRVYTEKTDDTPSGAEIAPAELVDLLKKPNPYMDYAELLELLVTDLLMVGNGYWLKFRQTSDGKPLALYRLAPAYVSIIPSQYGPKGYEYQPPGAKQVLTLSPEDVIHFRRPNPHSAYYGMGVIKGGGRPFDMELALTDTQASYFENKADPSLIVQSDRRIPRDVFNKLGTQLRRRASGTRNSGELLVLEAGLKASTLTPSAREAMFAELTKLSRDRIFAMFRCSPMLFGILDEAAGAIKPTEARREFDNKTMRPFLDKLESRITAGLVAAWDLDFKIDYGYVIPQEDLVKLAGDFAVIPGVKVSEIRRFMSPLGLTESTGDKTIDDMVLNLPGENMGPTGQGVNGGPGLADANIGSEPGRPPAGGSSAAFPTQGQALPAGAKARRPQGKSLSISEIAERLKEYEGKAQMSDGANFSIGSKLTNEQRPTDLLSDVRERDVDAIVEIIRSDLQGAAHTLERELLDHAEGKAFDPKATLSKIKKSAAWKSFQNLIEKAVTRGATQAISTAAVHHGTLGLTPNSEADYEAVAKEVIFRHGGIQKAAETLRNDLAAKLAGVTDKAEADRIIQTEINAWKLGQAETIALTEATEAYNEGTLVVAEASGVDAVYVTDGHDHDQPCIDADGQIWSIADARSNRTEHPRCRRAFVPMPAVS